MGWGIPSYYKENAATYNIDPSELDEETNELIKRYNNFDTILYNHARELFLKTLAENKTYLEEALPKLYQNNNRKRLFNKWFNKVMIFIKLNITG